MVILAVSRADVALFHSHVVWLPPVTTGLLDGLPVVTGPPTALATSSMERTEQAFEVCTGFDVPLVGAAAGAAIDAAVGAAVGAAAGAEGAGAVDESWFEPQAGTASSRGPTMARSRFRERMPSKLEAVLRSRPGFSAHVAGTTTTEARRDRPRRFQR